MVIEVYVRKDNGSEETFLNKVEARVRRILQDKAGEDPGAIRQNAIDAFAFENFGSYQISRKDSGAFVTIFPKD